MTLEVCNDMRRMADIQRESCIFILEGCII